MRPMLELQGQSLELFSQLRASRTSRHLTVLGRQLKLGQVTRGQSLHLELSSGSSVSEGVGEGAP